MGQYTWFQSRIEIGEDPKLNISFPLVLKFAVGPYRTESYDTGVIHEGRGGGTYHWTGVSLTRY